MRGYPFTNYISIAFLIFLVVVMCFSPDTRIAVIVGPLWLLLLVVYYYVSGIHKLSSVAVKSFCPESDKISSTITAVSDIKEIL